MERFWRLVISVISYGSSQVFAWFEETLARVLRACKKNFLFYWRNICSTGRSCSEPDQRLTRVSFSFALFCWLLKRNGFVHLMKKNKTLKKKRNVGNWFLAALSAIYLAESVLHLKCEKITAHLTRHITLLDIKVSLVESWNSCLSSGRTMQYFPPTAFSLRKRP